MKKIFLFLALLICSLVAVPFQGAVQAKQTYKVAWSHYTGWEPWAYADEYGILKKWGDKYGITIELSAPMDYIESINLYTAGEYIGCVMTNMDMLTIPAIGGIDSTALIIGDFSNGNDGIVTRTGSTVKSLKGKEIKLVELSVSHYLLSRALEMNSMTERDVTLVNTSDSDIGTVFATDPSGNAVTWNPILMQARNVPGTKMVFDSSQIPGEIIDMMVVRTDAPESVKKALTGAWFETMQIMSGRGTSSKEAVAFMAKKAGSTVNEFKAQLRTTAMFYNPKDAVAFSKSADLKKTMEYVRTFSFNHGLFEGATWKGHVGIEFPDHSVMGIVVNTTMRFDASYMQMAADGTL